jgi:hypothetical protein
VPELAFRRAEREQAERFLAALLGQADGRRRIRHRGRVDRGEPGRAGAAFLGEHAVDGEEPRPLSLEPARLAGRVDIGLSGARSLFRLRLCRGVAGEPEGRAECEKRDGARGRARAEKREHVDVPVVQGVGRPSRVDPRPGSLRGRVISPALLQAG